MDPQVGRPTSPRRTASRVSSPTGRPDSACTPAAGPARLAPAATSVTAIPPGTVPRPVHRAAPRPVPAPSARSPWCGTWPRSPRRCTGCGPGRGCRPWRAGRRWRRAAGTARGVTAGATEYSSRLASGARSRRWISAVPLPCRPMPMPEPGQPGGGQADPAEVHGVVEPDHPAAQPSSSSPASSSPSTSGTVSPDSERHTSRPTAGTRRSPRPAGPARPGPGPAGREQQFGGRSLLGAQVVDPAGLPDRRRFPPAGAATARTRYPGPRSHSGR